MCSERKNISVYSYVLLTYYTILYNSQIYNTLQYSINIYFLHTFYIYIIYIYIYFFQYLYIRKYLKYIVKFWPSKKAHFCSQNVYVYTHFIYICKKKISPPLRYLKPTLAKFIYETLSFVLNSFDFETQNDIMLSYQVRHSTPTPSVQQFPLTLSIPIPRLSPFLPMHSIVFLYIPIILGTYSMYKIHLHIQRLRNPAPHINIFPR